MANVIKFSCKYCGQEVNFPAPQQAGVYSVACPHCQKQMKVKYTPKPITMATAPSSASASVNENLRHKPTRRFNSSEEMFKNPTPQTPPKSTSVARLSRVRLGHDKEYFPLRLGDNTVGRKDSTQPSDIEIDGDETMSRRSVMITVSEVNGGYTYTLTVLKIFNPVLVNGKSVVVGQKMPITIGSSLYLGQTMLRLEN